MVSPIINEKGGRFCPALDASISAKRCGNERIRSLACPLACPHNPFNPNAPKSFDAVLTKGMPAMAKWLEEGIGSNEWARRFDAMDRRFHPERDLPLIAYEAQWAVLSMSRSGEAYGKLWENYQNGSGTPARNDACIFIDKLASSRVYLLEVAVASNALPYYTCRDALDPEREYLYVDFGDQDPLEAGAVLFGRFLRHENCLYVIPGIFVGTPEALSEIKEEVCSYLGSEGAAAAEAMQQLLPEIWNICARIQDAADGLEPGGYAEGEDPLGDEAEPCRVDLTVFTAKAEAVAVFREHPLFVEQDGQEFGFDPFKPTVFDVFVTPPKQSALDEDGELGEIREEEEALFAVEDDEEDEDEDDDELYGDKPVKVGTLFLDSERITLTGMNPVELELIKALVKALVRCEDAG